MNEYPTCSFSHSSVCKNDYFSKFNFFSSIIERINIGINPVTASTDNTQASSGSIMILLADDDCDDRELFEEAISQISSKIKVRTVEDCHQLMQILKDTHIPLPDILFLDLNMPGMLGVLFENLSSLSINHQEAALVKAFLQQVLGLTLESLPEKEMEMTPQIEQLIKDRDEARVQKDWTRADAIREQLKSLGYQAQDKKKM